MGTLESSGGIEYLTRLSSIVPTAANVSFYSRTVKEMSLRRKVIHEAGGIIQQAFNTEENVEEFLDEAEQKILSISNDNTTTTYHRIGDVVQDSIKMIEKLCEQRESITGVATGYTKFDELTSGLQPSDLIILAARPSMGKTALALSIGQNVALDRKLGVAVFSLEMSKEQLVMRMLCAEARIKNTKVRKGDLEGSDFPHLVNAAARISEAPIWIDDTPALSIGDLRARARRIHKEHKLSLIIVDYLQLMRSPAYSHSREQEISDISRSLKALAKELHVPVIALSQLNRSVENREKKIPQLSDLRESGAIEQDADIIMFIYRDVVYNPETPDPNLAELIISKHRAGPIGHIRLAFLGDYTRFENLEERDFAEPGAPSQESPVDLDLFEF
jgi:replicative DNA helicase